MPTNQLTSQLLPTVFIATTSLPWPGQTPPATQIQALPQPLDRTSNRTFLAVR